MDFEELKFKILELLAAFKYNYFGKVPKNEVEREEYGRLVKKGLINKQSVDAVEDMFNLGKAAQLFSHETVKNWDKTKLNKFVSTQGKLSKAEEATIDFVRAEAEDRLDVLFGKLVADTTNTYKTRMLGSDQFREYVRQSVEKKIEDRRTIRQLEMDIRDRTGEYGRDLYRIAFTESQNAYNIGIGVAEMKKTGKSADDILVARVPRGRGISCIHCLRLFLKSNTDEPKIFKLSELMGNTNVGRKARDYVPTLGCVHPWCSCQTVIVRPGMIWGPKNKTFVFVDK